MRAVRITNEKSQNANANHPVRTVVPVIATDWGGPKRGRKDARLDRIHAGDHDHDHAEGRVISIWGEHGPDHDQDRRRHGTVRRWCAVNAHDPDQDRGTGDQDRGIRITGAADDHVRDADRVRVVASRITGVDRGPLVVGAAGGVRGHTDIDWERLDAIFRLYFYLLAFIVVIDFFLVYFTVGLLIRVFDGNL